MFKKDNVNLDLDISKVDYEILGRTVKNFTSIENDLNYIGKCIDEIVATEDKRACLNAMSEMRIKLLEMQTTLKSFLADTEIYLAKN